MKTVSTDRELTEGDAVVANAIQQLLPECHHSDPKFDFSQLQIDRELANSLYEIVRDVLSDFDSIEQSIFLDSPCIHCLITYINWAMHQKRCNARILKNPQVNFPNEMSIAVIGASCRLPDHSNRFAGFQDLLKTAKAVESSFEHSKHPISGNFAECKLLAGFLSGPELFDHNFFAISPREAMFLDPKQRLLLQTSYNAIKHAPLLVRELSDKRTAFLIGVWSIDSYSCMLNADAISTAVQIAAQSDAVAAGRLAYFFDATGPALTVDTATSSAAVAVSLAQTNLTNGRAEIAICASAHLFFSTDIFSALSRSGILSPTSSCKTFDIAADGYMRSEAVAAMVCQRHSDSPIAWIRSSAVNQDGNSAGLLAPKQSAQTKVMVEAFQSTGLRFGQVECHGTGTRVGDAVELASVIESRKFSDKFPLILHSVKTMLGHTEPCCGMVALLRTIASRHHIVPHIHLYCLRGSSEQRFSVLVPIVEMTSESTISGVRCVGFSGTNVHLVTEVDCQKYFQISKSSHYLFLPLTAKSANALCRTKDNFAFLLQHNPSSADRICETVQALYEPFKYRHALYGNQLSELSTQLKTDIIPMQDEGTKKQKLTFLFTCADTAYKFMGYELYKSSPSYFNSISHCSDCANVHCEQLIFPANRSTALSQKLLSEHMETFLAIFSLQHALTQLMHKEWAIEPQAVLGHSFGEFGAAAAAKIMTIDDAVHLVHARAQAFQKVAYYGDRVTCSCNEPQALMLTNCCENSFLAAINHSNQLTFSVTSSETNQFSELLNWLEMQVKIIGPVPSHSPMMSSAVPELTGVAEKIQFSPPIVPYVSSVFACELRTVNANYWAAHMQNRIEFEKAVNFVTENLKSRTFLEIGPKPLLLNIVRTIDENTNLLSSIVPGKSNWTTLCSSLAWLFETGMNLHFCNSNHAKPWIATQLLEYDFEKVRFWVGISEEEHEIEVTHDNKIQSTKPEKSSIEDIVLATVSSVVGIEKTSINKNLSFMDIGMDSTMLMEFRDALQQKVKNWAHLPVTLTFDYPTVQQVIEFLHSSSNHTMQIDSKPQLNHYTDVIRKILCNITGAELEINSFAQLELDEQNTIEFHQRIQHEVGAKFELPPTLTLDYPSVSALAEYLKEQSHVHSNKTIQPNRTLQGFQSKSNQITVVGFSCNFPNTSDTVKNFWSSIEAGQDCICSCPIDRFDIEDYYDANLDARDKSYVREAAFLSKPISLFDNSFFNISAREAAVMDPQHRMVLQSSWHALESGAIKDVDIRNSSTCIFIGSMNNEFSDRLLDHHQISIDQFRMTASNSSVISGRLAYFYGNYGAAVTINTACSSSLVALQAAYMSLSHDDLTSSFGLVSGVDLIIDPVSFVIRCKSRMLSPDCHCKSLDVDGDGYARGEGCATFILECNSKHTKREFAVVAEARTNQDGQSSGLTAPNGSAQQQLIRNTLEKIGYMKIDFAELHGTGTALGDPVEVNALQTVVSQFQNEIVAGTIKINFGHCESASGIAGFGKILLAMKMSYIPMHRNWAVLNKLIDVQAIRTDLPIEGIQLEFKHCCTVSSFGMSGTNCFVPIVKLHKSTDTTLKMQSHCILALSAKSATSIRKQILELKAYVEDTTEVMPFCYSFCMRTHFKHRLAFVTSDVQDLAEQLSFVTSVPNNPSLRQMCHLFTGQGAQYPQMGYQLFTEKKEIGSIFSELFQHCDRDVPIEINEFITDQTEMKQYVKNLNNSQIVQPALFCLEYTLATAWQNWGIEPTVMIGHSLGEVVAATVAGVMDLQDAAMLVNVRGKVMQNSIGMMVAAQIDQHLAEIIASNIPNCWISCRNSPTSVVFTVLLSDVLLFRKLIYELECKVRVLEDYYISHCPLLNTAAHDLFQAIQTIKFEQSNVPIFSNITGNIESHLSTNYWRNQIIEQVNFTKCVSTSVVEAKIDCYLEIGPNPVLLQLVAQNLPDKAPILVPSLKKTEYDLRCMLLSAARLYTDGKDLDFQKSYPESQLCDPWILPNYSFDERSYWITNPEKEQAKRDTAVAGHKKSLDVKELKAYRKQSVTNLVENAVRNVVRKVSKIDHEQNFVQMGMNSITALEFYNNLQKALNSEIDIPALIAYEFPTTSAVIKFVKEKQESNRDKQEPLASRKIGCCHKISAKKSLALDVIVEENKAADAQNTIVICEHLTDFSVQADYKTLLTKFNKSITTILYDHLLFIDEVHRTHGQVTVGPVKFPPFVFYDLNDGLGNLFLCGHSMGGLLAYEIAQMIEQNYGAATCLLFFNDKTLLEKAGEGKIRFSLLENILKSQAKHIKSFVFDSEGGTEHFERFIKKSQNIKVSVEKVEQSNIDELLRAKILSAKINAIVAECKSL